jgi:hypothetical protein
MARNKEEFEREFKAAFQAGQDAVDHVDRSNPDFNAAQTIVAHYAAFKAITMAMPEGHEAAIKDLTDYVDALLVMTKPTAEAEIAAMKNTLKN